VQVTNEWRNVVVDDRRVYEPAPVDVSLTVTAKSDD